MQELVDAFGALGLEALRSDELLELLELVVSPSRTLTAAGFVDAFRHIQPDPRAHPGPSHRSGRRIDQLWFLGGLTNTSTRIVSTWPTAFPSDRYLIVATFDLSR